MEKQFVRFATATAKVAGKPWTFIACLGIVLLWAVSGPVFRFNETWQLAINTGTTIVTFLMVLQVATDVRRNDPVILQWVKGELGFFGTRSSAG